PEIKKSCNGAERLKGIICRILLFGFISNSIQIDVAMVRILLFVNTTPLGLPVVPDVYKIEASSSSVKSQAISSGEPLVSNVSNECQSPCASPVFIKRRSASLGTSCTCENIDSCVINTFASLC